MYFHGTAAQLKAITVGTNNTYFKKAAKHTNVHDYTKAVTKATLSKDGKIVYTCALCGAKKTTALRKVSKISLSKTKLVYSGKAQKPALYVRNSAGNAINSKYYTVSWSNASSKAIGRYTVTVTLKGIYSGKKTLTYSIVPKQVTGVKKTAATAKSIKLSWAKVTGGKYYQVYAKNAAGAWKLVKTVSVNYVTVTKIDGKALAPGKTYYFKVRALNAAKTCIGAFSPVYKAATAK